MTKSKAIHMESTGISVEKTCGEILELLTKHSVKGFRLSIENNYIDAIEFELDMDGHRICYRLPFLWWEIKQMAKRGETGYKTTANEDQARRVSARLCYRWLQAQLDFVRVKQAKMAQLFLPFMLDGSGQTFWEHVSEGRLPLLLEAANKRGDRNGK